MAERNQAAEIEPNTDVDPSYRLVSTATVCRLIDCSDVSIWRWRRDPDIAFPEPVRIGGKCYWRLADVHRWIDRQYAAEPA